MTGMGEIDLRDEADDFEDAASADFAERFGFAPL